MVCDNSMMCATDNLLMIRQEKGLKYAYKKPPIDESDIKINYSNDNAQRETLCSEGR